jgi:dihydrofolate reductase
MSSAHRTSLIGIVAMTAKRVIGRDGTLPWHLPDDLAFFKKQTSGHAIIMGRKTFDSIGRPLPKRHNIVLTRDTTWSHPGVQVIHSPADLTGLLSSEEEAYIIGGAEIYQTFLPHMDSLLITHVKEEHHGDTIFPDYATIFPHEEMILEHPQFLVKRHSR